MRNYTLKRETFVRKPIAEAFDFFSRAENLEKLTPPWLSFHILTPPLQLRRGARIAYQLRIRGVPAKWVSEIEEWDPPFGFVDVQVKGPYNRWRHVHRFSEVAGGTRIQDAVTYALPFGPLGRIAHWLLVARDLSKIFDYREQRVREILG